MIGMLRGKVVATGEDYLLLDVAGVGYQVYMPATSLAHFTDKEEVVIYTYLHVREDALVLYGFQGKRELDFFKLLLGVSGLGPKGALGILGSSHLQRVAEAIINEDTSFLATLPGIGKKIAQRMVVELREKLAKDWQLEMPGPGAPSSKSQVGSAYSDALAGLLALGYTQNDVRQWLDKAQQELGTDVETEALIKFVLREVGMQKM